MSESWKKGEETFAGEIRNKITIARGHTQMLEEYGIFPKTANHFKEIFKALDELDTISEYPELNKKPKRSKE